MGGGGGARACSRATRAVERFGPHQLQRLAGQGIEIEAGHDQDQLLEPVGEVGGHRLREAVVCGQAGRPATAPPGR